MNHPHFSGRTPEPGLQTLLAREYGIEADARPLGGEGVNYGVVWGGRQAVLKLGPASLSEDELSFEHEIVEHLAARSVPLALPRSVRTVSGGAWTRRTVGRGMPARLLEWVEGKAWRDALPATPARLRALGGALAAVDVALADFRHPAAGRTHPWDLTRADGHAGLIELVPDARRRRLLEEVFNRFRACALPHLGALPRGPIHGDANDENVLVDGDRIAGLIDFGDALENPLVCELAIALAYALLDPTMPLEQGAEVVAGYHEVRALSREELRVLHPLVCARLGVSVAIAAQRRLAADAPAAWFITEDAAWSLLERIAAIDPVEAGRMLAARLDVADPFVEDEGVAPGTLLDRRARSIGPSLSVSYGEPLSIVRGRGAYLFDHRGRPYLDLVNNVCHVGHCHPHVVAAGQRQMAALNTNTRYLHPLVLEYAERLTATLPAPLRVCYFVNSGSEANELALRLAQAATGRRATLVVEGAYHGNTARLIELSHYKFMGPGGSGRPGPDVLVAPAPDGYRGAHRGRDAETGRAWGDEVLRTIEMAGAPIGAFLVEPLLSCAGQIIPPPGWLETAFRHVRAAGGICIVDEVQTGFGRVGTHFWAFETQNVVPDVVVMGKPAGNGHPLAVVVTTPAIAQAFANGMEFFSTFGGNPVSCAIGLAVLDVIEAEGLQEQARRLGTLLLDGLRALAGHQPLIGDVRGAGLFLGIELVRDRETRAPAPAAAAEVVNALRARGVLVSTDGPAHNVLKVKPPLVLEAGAAGMFIRCLDDVLNRISADATA